MRHSTFYVYYCRFSVAYLEKFVQYLNVGDNLATNEKMSLLRSLLRSKPYNCAVTAERVRFFELMAHMLFYITSGEAEIRCLADNTDNPLLTVVSFKVYADNRINRGVTEFSMTHFIKAKYMFSKNRSMRIKIG